MISSNPKSFFIQFQNLISSVTVTLDDVAQQLVKCFPIKQPKNKLYTIRINTQPTVHRNSVLNQIDIYIYTQLFSHLDVCTLLSCGCHCKQGRKQKLVVENTLRLHDNNTRTSAQENLCIYTVILSSGCSRVIIMRMPL